MLKFVSQIVLLLEYVLLKRKFLIITLVIDSPPLPVTNLIHQTITYLYLGPQQFLWYQWLCEHTKSTIISCSIFTKELIAYHDDVKRISFFIQLINLRKTHLVIKHIQQFQ